MNALLGFLYLLAPEPDARPPLDLRAQPLAGQIRAVQAIERRGAEGLADAGVLPALMPLLADRDERLRGLATLAVSRHLSGLGTQPPDGLVSALVARLGDGNPHIAGLAARSLRLLGVRAVPELEAWFQPEQVEKRPVAKRRLALEACRIVGHDRGAFPALETPLWLAMTDPHPGVAERARLLLVTLRLQQKPPPYRREAPVRAALASPSEEVRDLAWRTLLNMEEAAFSAAVALLDSPRPDLQTRGLELLRSLEQRRLQPTPAETQKLLALHRGPIRPEWEKQRLWLAQIARWQAEPAAEVVRTVDLWLGTLADGKGDWNAALIALSDQPEQSIRVLAQRLTSAPPAIQRQAAEGLLEMLRDPPMPVAREIQDALALGCYLPGPEATDLCIRALRMTVRRDPGHPLTPLAIEGLLACLRDDELTERHSCTWLLASQGLRVEEQLLALLRDRDPRIREQGLEVAVKMVRDFGVRPLRARAVVERMTTDRNEAVRKAVPEALSWLHRSLPLGIRP